MKRINVLLSSRPKLLSEVIRSLIEHQSDMKVVGEVLDPLQLLPAARKTAVDAVIITPLNANGEPKICHLLLAEHPLVIIVTQSSKGDAAYLYRAGVPKQRLEEPTGYSILAIIRQLCSPIVS
ncbi:MAG: hypothetical protein WAN36_07085 [Calditrichia bacterium]